MNLLEKVKESRYILIGFFVIIMLLIFLLILDVNFFYIKHNNLGPALPVITYVYYPNWKVLNNYLLISLCMINIGLILSTHKKIKKLSFAISPIIGIISMILIQTNPEYLILFPEGTPKTRLENLEIGGYFYLVLTLFFTFSTIYAIYQEGFLKKYSQYFGIFLIVWFFSTFIHENGHAFFVLISGGEITKYAALPFLDFNNFAGYVAWRSVPTHLIPLVTLGGEIFQWISIPFLLGVIKFKKYNKWMNLFLNLTVIVAWLDFPLYTINNTIGIPHWFLIGGSSGDIIKFTIITGFPLILMNIFAFLQLLAGFIVIYLKIFKASSNFKKKINAYLTMDTKIDF